MNQFCKLNSEVEVTNLFVKLPYVHEDEESGLNADFKDFNQDPDDKNYLNRH